MKHLLTLSIFVIIALAFWVLANYEDEQDIIAEEVDPHFVDIFMRNFTLTAMGEDGKPTYTLQASKFEHYNDDSLSHMEKPVIHLLQENNSWLITADTGKLDNDNNMIFLHDNVIVLQQQTGFPVQIKTSQLSIDTSIQIAKSDHQVNITQKNLKLNSKGMILDYTASKLELLASVKGRYAQTN